MNKGLLLGFGAVVVGTAAASPFWFGAQIENQFRTQLEQYKNNTAFPPWLGMHIDEYKRGWLDSTARTSLTIDMAKLVPAEDGKEPLESINIVFEHTIKHGPLSDAGLSMGVIESRLVVSEQHTGIVSHYFGDQSPVQQTTIVSLNGESNTEIRILPYEGPSHDNKAMIEWQGLNGNIRGQWQLLEGEGNFKAPLLQVSADDTHVVVKDFAFEGDSRISPEGLGLGNGSASIDTIEIRGKNPSGQANHIKMQAFKISVRSDQQGELIDFNENISFAKLMVDEIVNVGPAELDIELRNLDAQVMANLQDRMHAIESNAITPEQMGAVYGMAMMEFLPQLLQQSPEIELSKIDLATDQGQINSSLFIGFDGAGDLQLQPLPALIPRLTVDLKTRIPTSYALMMAESQARQQIATALEASDQEVSEEEFEKLIADAKHQQLNQLEQMNFIVRDGENHKAHLNFSNGHLTINGQAQDQLLGMLPIPTGSQGF